MKRVIFSIVSLLMFGGLSIDAAETQASVTYEVRGVVKELNAAEHEITIDHEEIPNYMPAMIMPFTVRNLKEIESVKPNDRIVFKFHVAKSEAWIDSVRKEGAVEAVKKESAGMAKVEPLKVGDLLPNFALIDEQNRPLELKNYRGQILALTFIFTRCPYPTYCPLISGHFATVQQSLLADATAPSNWQLLSVTIDPEHDQPEVLREYGKRHASNPERWRFATGSLRDITVLALHCGLGFWEERGTIAHDLRTVVVGADGRIRRIFPDNTWKPEELIQEVRLAAAAAK